MTTAIVLSPPEVADLAQLERVVERGARTFVAVGAALAEIRDRRLYRAEHGTFAAYCRARWQFGRIHAHRLIEAAGIVEMLPLGNTPPANERQARALAAVTESDRAAVWQQARDHAAAEDRQVTAADIDAARIVVTLRSLAAEIRNATDPDEQRDDAIRDRAHAIRSAACQVIDRTHDPRYLRDLIAAAASLEEAVIAHRETAARMVARS